ncbi:hypothetical protein RB195_002686 [Necator americanus]|uniref:Uncharacterized protein n=1 Tax=Necator americanus TaxID=51031 RepID=A0ABR1DKF7_NECAM
MKSGKSGGDNRISAEVLKYLPPFGICEMTKIISSIWIDHRMRDVWRHAVIILLHKKLSAADPNNYRGISLLRVTHKVLEQIILYRLIKHREETTRDEQRRACWPIYDRPGVHRQESDRNPAAVFEENAISVSGL